MEFIILFQSIHHGKTLPLSPHSLEIDVSLQVKSFFLAFRMCVSVFHTKLFPLPRWNNGASLFDSSKISSASSSSPFLDKNVMKTSYAKGRGEGRNHIQTFFLIFYWCKIETVVNNRSHSRWVSEWMNDTQSVRECGVFRLSAIQSICDAMQLRFARLTSSTKYIHIYIVGSSGGGDCKDCINIFTIVCLYTYTTYNTKYIQYISV